MKKRLYRLPHEAGLWVPVLALPIIAVELYHVTAGRHGGTGGQISFAATIIAIGWCMLGGGIAFSRLRDEFRRRRELARLKSRLSTSGKMAWAVCKDGRILAQSDLACKRWQDLIDAQLSQLLSGQFADAEGAAARLRAQAFRHGHAVSELPSQDRLIAERSGCELLYLWIEEAEPGLAVDNTRKYDALPIAMMLIDQKGRIAYVNSAARPYCGQDSEGEHVSRVFDGLGRPFDDWLAEARSAVNPVVPEVLHAPGAGQDRFIQVSLYPEDEDRANLLAVLTDARAMKTLEAQFVQGQKMQAIGQLAGGIAHDFNNLLTAIGGYCDMLMLRRGKDDPDYADLDQINQNTSRAANLVSHLLAFSRKQTLKPQRLELREMFSDLSHLLKRLLGDRIRLHFSYDSVLEPVRADRGKIEQVIVNLVVNARDAMPDGGSVSIVTRNVAFGEAQHFGRFAIPPGKYVRISVVDEGCGVPADIAEKVFEPFFTTKEVGEGTGLGLSTAYGIVKQTGGYIMFETRLGKGTSFCVYLPAYNGQDDDMTETAPASRSVLRKPSDQVVLLAEDESSVRAFAARALRLKGYEVLEAESGDKALGLLGDDSLKVDIFVSDVVMPGLDGPSWVRQALKDRPAAGVIFMSGYTEDVFEDGRSPIDGASFLQKPFSLGGLTAAVEAKLDEMV
ncbi:ATP-binding protein [Paracoccus aerodenitrificans]|uniref:ATP-binding protein n=1 Tax=Paracoccus aerodenitrificans TaxID=3017781 RepID=UPI0022F09CE4|nr:ATP-binding protein [Paracoccus aerodenitrificans]WBU64993.1 ATP-binding protein [Paracoccus aerodenitrificans]